MSGWGGNKLCTLKGRENTAGANRAVRAQLGNIWSSRILGCVGWVLRGASGAPWSRPRGRLGPLPHAWAPRVPDPRFRALVPFPRGFRARLRRGSAQSRSGRTQPRRRLITSVPRRTGILMPGYKLLMYFAAGH